MLNERNIPLEEDGIEEEILVDEEVTITKAMWGDIGGNIANQTDLQNALDAKQDDLTEAQLNAVNSGITAEKVTTYDGYADQIASKANQSALNAESTTRAQADTALGTRIDNEALARQQADNGLQTQIDAITSKSDVVDVVANYAALQAYDTSSLGNNDVIKVLDDETHEDALTYYRWSTTTQTWSYIGQEAPYYSKGQMDVMLQGKQDKLTAGANIQIQNGTITATDTTYTAGNGLNLDGTEFSADTDILATKEDLEGYYTKPETDNLLLPKLEAEVVAELPTTGEEGKLYLTPKAHTTQTATGNPITATVAEEAGAIESFQLDGDTFQQTYTGKNLLVLEGNTDNGVTGTVVNGNTVTVTGKATATSAKVATSPIDIPAGTYTLSIDRTYAKVVNVILGTNNGAVSFRIASGQTSATATLTADAYDASIWVGLTNGTTYNETFKLQLVAGSTADYDYEPYVGGQPSPNPDYPQPIQTVTGTQTITINGTDYPLGLGDIELCGIGNYRDRVKKTNDKWYIEEQFGKLVLDGSESSWTLVSTATNTARFKYTLANTVANAPSEVITISDNFTSYPSNDRTADKDGITTYPSRDLYVRTALATASTLEDFKTWLSTHPTTVNYALATPTETEITDTTLIAQLEAIRTALLQNGANTITNTATGSNLAGDMEIGYYGFAPRNRYDKWLWLDINNEYEQIGS